ncbi:poly-gamma-glutamate synthesis protein (capsule biosynthesis protein) [Gracilibacillus orientalis]|uniref:Poly-gamma-glutamate synthesis protein (Capsule biosynthesis protein) n=1 Tax=Gracilibacillus orientalis TaxID=334253 RepID=A0A1I4PQ69_9BACI|nr:CapA family protein [Gracilibacillus orientalis]SFM29623.1 poly-gamma-glutamate synthesis protein (capsule biosynthesis protein) [Gracilibacillus orientalis]
MKNVCTALLIILFLIIAGCEGQQEYQGHSHHTNEIDRPTKDTDINLFEHEISIAAIGDILIHARVYDDGWNGERYDFLSMLEPVKEYLKQPDITMANQETIMGGEEIGLSTYPQFNSPFELGEDLKKVGVDVVTMANNHTLDRGEEAIYNATNYYEEIGMHYTGSFNSEEDQRTLRVIETEEDISVAFLSYTYGTNGIPVPDGKDYLVNLIDREQIEREVTEAEEQADVTIVSYHFGEEYQRLPNQQQTDLAQFAADLGADVVIGHHPHVLQPLDWLEGKDGNQTLVAYSLGNFLSGQYELYKRIGGILQFSIKKDGTQVKVHSPSFLPTFVQFDMISDTMTDVQVLPLKDVSDQQLPDASDHLAEIKEHLSQNIEDLQFIE